MNKSAKMANLLKREDCILIFIDFQERLLPVIHNRDKVLENAVKLARFANIVNMPVIVTEQEKLGNTVSELKNELSVRPFVSKVHFNCFESEGFLDILKKLNRNTLVITGVEAHICVAQTALCGLTQYSIHVVEDAISSRTEKNCLVAVERMRHAGVVITTTEMFIYEILKKAGTEEFKKALQLVK